MSEIHLRLEPDNRALGRRARIELATENARRCREYVLELQSEKLEAEKWGATGAIEEIADQIKEAESAASSWESLADSLAGDE